MAAQDSSSDVLRDYIIVKFLADRPKNSPRRRREEGGERGREEGGEGEDSFSRLLATQPYAFPPWGIVCMMVGTGKKRGEGGVRALGF